MEESLVSINIKTQYPAIERQLEAIKRRLNIPNSPTPTDVDLDIDLSLPSCRKATTSPTTSTSSSLVSVDRRTSISKNSILRVSFNHSDADKSTSSRVLDENSCRYRVWDDPIHDGRGVDPSKLEREFIILLAKSKTEQQMSKFRRPTYDRGIY